MIERFIQKMKDPQTRKLFYAIFGGKLLGVALMFLICMYFSRHSLARTRCTPT